MRFSRLFKVLIDLRFSIFLLFLVAFSSSLGSFIEQEQSDLFYQQNYLIEKPFYGFLSYPVIFFFGLDHIYRTFWFLTLIFTLAFSLIGCTFSRQFPLLKISKDLLFKKEVKSFLRLPFFSKLQNSYYFLESGIIKLQESNFFLYQKKHLIYGYKGLIGRISPILVHISLLIILSGSLFGAFQNFKVQEILPKGELFHLQNPIQIGWFTSFPDYTIRVNDFWLEYKEGIHQFYSNLSLLDRYGRELFEKTISVNNPLKYFGIDIYQSDWNLIAIREKFSSINIQEYPLFPIKDETKIWISFLNEKYYFLIDGLEDKYFLYDENFQLLKEASFYNLFDNSASIVENLSSTGLLIKYNPSIVFIYFGFAILILTTFLSYFPYTQIWIFQNQEEIFLGSLTNRGKIQLEIEFENFLRRLQKILMKRENQF